MKRIFYFFITAITIINFNSSRAMELPTPQASDSSMRIIEGTITTFSANSIKYVIPENLNGVAKQLYQRYHISTSIPCINVEVKFNSDFEKKDKVIDNCRNGIPLTLLAPFFDETNKDPIVEFVINQYKFKLKPLGKGIPCLFRDYESQFITNINNINFYAPEKDKLIENGIISDTADSVDRYAHGKNGYPAYKNKGFFTIFEAMRATIDNPSQTITITSNNESQKPCDQCFQKDITIQSLNEKNIRLRIENSNLTKQILHDLKNNIDISLTNHEKFKEQEPTDSQVDHLTPLAQQIGLGLYAQASSRAKTFGSIAFISAFLGIGTGLYAWYKPSQSPIMPMLSTFFFGGATTSGIAAWHFHTMVKK